MRHRSRHGPPAPSEYRLPLRLVRERFGGDNFDDAGDAIAAAANALALPARPRLEFDFDDGHANPWHHAMVVRVYGLDAQAQARMAQALRALGLEPE